MPTSWPHLQLWSSRALNLTLSPLFCPPNTPLAQHTMPTQGFNIKSLMQNEFKLNVWDIGGESAHGQRAVGGEERFSGASADLSGELHSRQLKNPYSSRVVSVLSAHRCFLAPPHHTNPPPPTSSLQDKSPFDPTGGTTSTRLTLLFT